ncbi:MAG: hypothetical protein JST58_04585 [Bacteroidetes bacterium]|jgi:hypothetical protein|nr:hypothetical protein [Bacteroidota bacterium]
MQQTEDHIKRVQDKLQQLLQQYQSLQKENSRLKAEIQEEKNKSKERLLQLDRLQQQVEILKTSKEEMSQEDKKNFEKRLNQYVKEIDKCITLLKD